MLDQFSAPKSASAGAGNLAKLRALVEVARALQNSLSTDDVLAAVVDAALAITGFERGFLLLNAMALCMCSSRETVTAIRSRRTK